MRLSRRAVDPRELSSAPPFAGSTTSRCPLRTESSTTSRRSSLAFPPASRPTSRTPRRSSRTRTRCRRSRPRATAPRSTATRRCSRSPTRAETGAKTTSARRTWRCVASRRALGSGAGTLMCLSSQCYVYRFAAYLLNVLLGIYLLSSLLFFPQPHGRVRRPRPMCAFSKLTLRPLAGGPH